MFYFIWLHDSLLTIVSLDYACCQAFVNNNIYTKSRKAPLEIITSDFYTPTLSLILLIFIHYIDSQIVVSSSKDTTELIMLNLSGFYCFYSEHHIEYHLE